MGVSGRDHEIGTGHGAGFFHGGTHGFDQFPGGADEIECDQRRAGGAIVEHERAGMDVIENALAGAKVIVTRHVDAFGRIDDDLCIFDTEIFDERHAANGDEQHLGFKRNGFALCILA